MEGIPDADRIDRARCAQAAWIWCGVESARAAGTRGSIDRRGCSDEGAVFTRAADDRRRANIRGVIGAKLLAFTVLTAHSVVMGAFLEATARRDRLDRHRCLFLAYLALGS
ncbi:hypothetical protein BDI4_430077 [Burkholderia diffusa]|nr:hypothetical protein BDI4_430077 [Burkholderia diffusa]